MINDSILNWTQCVFQTLAVGEDWKMKCGDAPSVRPSYSFNVFVLVFVAGQGIVITLIFELGNIMILSGRIATCR